MIQIKEGKASQRQVTLFSETSKLMWDIHCQFSTGWETNISVDVLMIAHREPFMLGTDFLAYKMMVHGQWQPIVQLFKDSGSFRTDTYGRRVPTTIPITVRPAVRINPPKFVERILE